MSDHAFRLVAGGIVMGALTVLTVVIFVIATNPSKVFFAIWFATSFLLLCYVAGVLVEKASGRI